jgi:hypothetical protein
MFGSAILGAFVGVGGVWLYFALMVPAGGGEGGYTVLAQFALAVIFAGYMGAFLGAVIGIKIAFRKPTPPVPPRGDL